jgi:hypothetical protein
LVRELAALNARMAEDRRVGIETDFYFVYTGHGAVEYGEGYVNLGDGRLSRMDLFDLVIQPSQAAFNHIIVDACQSYYMVYGRGEESWQDDRLDGDYSGVVSAYQSRFDLTRYSNTGVILSTSTDKASHEWSSYAAGVFSHQLRSALVGTADIDVDGSISYLELEAYLAAANAAVIDPKARVQVYAQAPRSNSGRPLFVLPGGDRARTLEIAAHIGGKFHIEDERGVRYADFHKAADGPLRVVLLPGHRYTLHGEQGEMALASDESNLRLDELRWTPHALAQRNAISEAFRKNLYASPFSRDFFAGYALRYGSAPSR